VHSKADKKSALLLSSKQIIVVLTLTVLLTFIISSTLIRVNWSTPIGRGDMINVSSTVSVNTAILVTIIFYAATIRGAQSNCKKNLKEVLNPNFRPFSFELRKNYIF